MKKLLLVIFFLSLFFTMIPSSTVFAEETKSDHPNSEISGASGMSYYQS